MLTPGVAAPRIKGASEPGSHMAPKGRHPQAAVAVVTTIFRSSGSCTRSPEDGVTVFWHLAAALRRAGWPAAPSLTSVPFLLGPLAPARLRPPHPQAAAGPQEGAACGLWQSWSPRLSGQQTKEQGCWVDKWGTQEQTEVLTAVSQQARVPSR